MVDRGGVPEWKNDERFKDDVFTFVRVRYSSYGSRRLGRMAAAASGPPTIPTAT